jgi:hypothetical protein
MRIALLLALLAAPAAGREQEPPPLPPGVDDFKVDKAIKAGVAWLMKDYPEAKDWRQSDELVLWTFVHADVPPSEPKYKKLLDGMLAAPLEKTYRVALQAMILEEIDRAKHQERIAHCAQFLIDNQCKNGQWSYGTPTPHLKDVPTIKVKEDVATTSGSGEVKTYAPGEKKPKPKVTQKIMLKKMRDGPDTGDNSNSQYAALGLRACRDAGVYVPEEVLLMALKWWRESQFKSEKKDNAVATGTSGDAEGWNYKNKELQQKEPYHAMTAGGVSSLVIYEHLLGRDWKRSSSVKQGVNWLTEHYAVNTGYYYMYGLERACILYGTEKLGDKFWYADGAKVLIKAQKPDGSWSGKHKDDEAFRGVWDTCFAILFLKRATRPIATESGGKK